MFSCVEPMCQILEILSGTEMPFTRQWAALVEDDQVMANTTKFLKSLQLAAIAYRNTVLFQQANVYLHGTNFPNCHSLTCLPC